MSTSREPALDSPWLQLAEVCRYARAGRTDVLAALADGTLRGSQLKPGGKWRIHRDDVDAWLRGEKPPAGEPERFTRRRSA